MIKPSVSLSLFDAPPGAPILFSNNIAVNIPLIAGLGYQGVDLFVQDPDAEVSQEALKLLNEYDLGVGAVMPAALAGEGLFLADRNPEIRREVIRRLDGIIRYAAEAGGMVSLGLVRGNNVPGETVQETLNRFSDTIEKILPVSESCGVPLMVEPINRYEINTLNSSIESCDYIQESGLPLYLMLDTFHMNIEDVSIHESFRYCRDYLRHVHFLDSNRLAPGMGHLDMESIMQTLWEIDYRGFLCLEALPKPDAAACARRGAEFFQAAGLIKRKKI
ncbi:MAG: sugar phosphate isomerase/epimerase [Spirochaetaceae bacterium]|nr:sugar phosphate isomerase/epimerase [Spirochaetaceae bacterium]